MYTVEEAATLLSISRAQIYRLIDSCQLGSVTVGRSRRITLSQLTAFTRSLEEASSREALRLREHLGHGLASLESFGP